MHGPIQDRLEDLLGADLLAVRHNDVSSHLASCSECATELAIMQAQSATLSRFKSRETLDPASGFYARVLQRIEERESSPFWSFFADSPFTKRLTVASLTIALALGGYVASQEASDHRLQNNILALSSDSHYDALVMGSPAEQRDAVLENFASHRTVAAEGRVQ